MAFFTAHFDASGSDLSHPVVVVSGFIAHHVQWRHLEDLWVKYHRDYGVNLPFHMADFDSALNNPKYETQTNHRQDYVELAKDKRRAVEFLLKLSMAEVTLMSCAVTAIVPMIAVYNEIDSVIKLSEIVPPYALGARMCIELVRKWEQTFDLKVPVECIFEKGDFGQGNFSNLMVDEGMDLPIYKDKVALLGLQAADHYAWERAYFSKRVEDKNMPTRPTYDMVITIPNLHRQVTRELLLDVCHMKHIDPRTGVKR
jgi:hypothetical protein